MSDKIHVIERFLEIADEILIGGAMAFPFLAAQGHAVGSSLCASEDIEHARTLLALEAGASGESAAASRSGRSPITSAPTHVAMQVDGVDLADGLMGLDIGPRTIAEYTRPDRRAPAPSSGTARWAHSSLSRSPPVPGGGRGARERRRDYGRRRRRLGRSGAASSGWRRR